MGDERISAVSRPVGSGSGPSRLWCQHLEPTPPRPTCQGRGQSLSVRSSNVNGRRMRSMEFCRRSAHSRNSCNPLAHRVGQVVLLPGHRLHQRAGELGLHDQFPSEITGVRRGNGRHLVAQPGELQDREGPADSRRQRADDRTAVLPGRGQHQVCPRDQRGAHLNGLVRGDLRAGVRRARSPRRDAAASDPECPCRPTRSASRPGRRNARGRHGPAIARRSGSGSDLRCRSPGPGKSPLPAPRPGTWRRNRRTCRRRLYKPGVGTAGPAGADFTSPRPVGQSRSLRHRGATIYSGSGW